MLSDVLLQEFLNSNRIRISPQVREEDIRPTGIRVHLSEKILIPVPGADAITLDGAPGPEFTSDIIGENGYELPPGGFVLGSTREIISADPWLVCQIDGRSSLARLGLMIHCGSSIFDHIQSEGRAITLELVNLGRFTIKLRVGDPIAQITFSLLSSPVRQPAYGQYEGQEGPVAPRLGYKEGERP